MGNLCDGVPEHIQKTIRNSRAYCEGVQARLHDLGDNPHLLDAEAFRAWLAGFQDAADGTVRGCCAGRTRTIQPLPVPRVQYEERMRGYGYDVFRTSGNKTLFSKPDWARPFRLSWAQINSKRVEQYLPPDLVEPDRSQFLADNKAALTP